MRTNVGEEAMLALEQRIAEEKTVNAIEAGSEPIVYRVYFNKLNPPNVVPIDLIGNHILGLHLNDYGKLNPPLQDKLANIARTVNEGIEYDYDKAEARDAQDIKVEGMGPIVFDRFDNQNPSKPTGICDDSTRLMTYRIETDVNANSQQIYWIDRGLSRKPQSRHAVVFCFDKEGHWVVLNGKTPSNNYDIIPKDKLRAEFTRFESYFEEVVE